MWGIDWDYETGVAHGTEWSERSSPVPIKERDKRVDSCVTWDGACGGGSRMGLQAGCMLSVGSWRRAPLVRRLPWRLRAASLGCWGYVTLRVRGGIIGVGVTGVETVGTVWLYRVALW